MVGTAIGIWCSAGLMTGPYARYGTIVLGVLLVIYAIIGLSKFTFHVAPANEKWVGGIVGLITGVVSAATGVQVIPVDAVHAGDRHGKGRAGAGARRVLHRRHRRAGLQPHQRRPADGSTALPGAVAMVGAFAGMFIGQAVRSRMEPETFRRWFLIALILLGTYLAGTATYELLR